MKEKDIYIKDEGDFGTVIFVTDKAKTVAEYHGLKNDEYPYYKIDLPELELYKIIAFAASHNLSVDSEMNIIVPSKN